VPVSPHSVKEGNRKEEKSITEEDGEERERIKTRTVTGNLTTME